MIIAVDFDGTCTTHEYPHIGRDIGAERVLKRLVADGNRIILWTMRSGNELDEAVQWFQKRNIPLFGVNRNPHQINWTKSPKPYAQLYIDDAALGCPLCKPRHPGDTQYVDWEAVEQMLFPLAGEPSRTIEGGAISCSAGQPRVRPPNLWAKILVCLGISV